jgi:cell pole-organizing protein PopZ
LAGSKASNSIESRAGNSVESNAMSLAEIRASSSVGSKENSSAEKKSATSRVEGKPAESKATDSSIASQVVRLAGVRRPRSSASREAHAAMNSAGRRDESRATNRKGTSDAATSISRVPGMPGRKDR